MLSKRTIFVSLSLVVALGISSCSLPLAGLSPTATPNLAETAIVAATQTSRARPPTETATPPPTETIPLAFTETPTSTPEPSFTPTVELVTAEVFRETNCRTGPSSAYDLVATFQAGTILEVVAKDLGNGFWFVKVPEKPDTFCWLWGNNAKVSGNTEPLPALSPLPSPTLMPDFSVEFKNYDQCNGFFMRFTVQNTGSSTFRSVYVKAINTKANETVERVSNAFDLTTKCVVAKNIFPLNPGSTGYVQTGVFAKNPAGQKINVVVMMCTDQYLKGTCITRVLEVKK